MPGIGELIDGAMQQAPQPERQASNDMNCTSCGCLVDEPKRAIIHRS
jgi:hypothetical protein